MEIPSVNEGGYQDKKGLKAYITRERRIDLARKGNRYYDLKGWNIAQGELPPLEKPVIRPLVFEQQNHVLPFPNSELNNNPGL